MFTTKAVYTINLAKTIKKHNVADINDADKEKMYIELIVLNIDNEENRKAHVEAIHNNIAKKNEKFSDNI